ncbi:MAG: hypothetical protein ACLTKZ_00205 [Lachnospiraceae bacterium]
MYAFFGRKISVIGLVCIAIIVLLAIFVPFSVSTATMK